MTRPAPYAAIIAPLAPGYDPRHIEAYMRLQYGTLSHLSRDDFAREAKICMACVDTAGVEAAERCARSYGL